MAIKSCEFNLTFDLRSRRRMSNGVFSVNNLQSISKEAEMFALG